MTRKHSLISSGQLSAKQGATTILVAVFILSILLMISLTGASVMVYEIKMAKEISDSVLAFMAADAGAEKCLYQVRKGSEGCASVNGSATISLDNGATVIATRAASKKIISQGVFNQTNRKVELSW